MNKLAIQKFAVWARSELLAQVAQRAYCYGISPEQSGERDALMVNGRALTESERRKRSALIRKIEQKGFAQVMEEAAYTWFNRFIALRFMELNDFLPSHVRVFSDASGAFKPEILRDAHLLDLPGLDQRRVAALREANREEELYRYLLLTQCNALQPLLPGLFRTLDDEADLLLPDNILRPSGVIARMLSDIPSEDWLHQVQIIGWLYQYYNTEPKAETYALLKKNVKVSKERIPAATQLFTPDWIVRYMVENSLGRLWLNAHPEHAGLKANWRYYLEEAEQVPAVLDHLVAVRAESRSLSPRDIRVIDPCMGSGHILVYAFEVLMQIYKECGYGEREAAAEIVQHNLFGLDIDDRAAQLAYFAVMMKARQYDRRLFSRGLSPHLHACAESNALAAQAEAIAYFTAGNAQLQADFDSILHDLQDAREFGSILSVAPVDLAALEARVEQVRLEGGLYRDVVLNQFLPLIQTAKLLSWQYDVVVTNPPYMGSTGMNRKLSAFLKSHFPDSKSDLFSVFMERGGVMTKPRGFNCMVTMQSWMFLSGFEKLREKLLQSRTMVNLMHMENMVMGIAFGTAVSIFYNDCVSGYRGTYNQIKFRDIEDDRPVEFPVRDNRYAQVCSSNFTQIPGSPIAYWVSESMLRAFAQGTPLGDIAAPKEGLKTGDNDRFLRLWHEVPLSDIKFDAANREEALASGKKWIPHNKGGAFRKWYGNDDYVINWENDGEELRNFKGAGVSNTQYYFRECFSWSRVTSGNTAFRYKPHGFIPNMAGLSCVADANLMYLLALCNSVVIGEMLKIVSPTINCTSGDVAILPVIFPSDRSLQDRVEALAQACVELSRADWDSFETSWDFRRHPLANGCRIAEAYEAWSAECEERFARMKAHEEELNRLFLEIYGMQGDLSPEVRAEEVSVRRADRERDVKGLLSYAVGCMLGRYSTDREGVVYAGGVWDESLYESFRPDDDNVIPICCDDYFEDDILGRLIEWLQAVYGADSLEENLSFIAESLGGKGGSTAREVIRSYFLNGFYADHVKMYGKRPIYWLCDSGKKHGFKALLYVHRYRSDLLARIRTEYVHEQQGRYSSQLDFAESKLIQASGSERVRLNKQVKQLQDQMHEIRSYEEKMHHLADSNIALSPDDGIVHNYALLSDILAKIK